MARSTSYRCWLSVYEPETLAWANRLTVPGAVVIDVGAHVGFFSLCFAQLGASVHAFEPVARNAAYLRRHMALNGCSDRVVVNRTAIGDHVGVAAFTPGDSVAKGRLASSDTSYRIECDTLDAYVERRGLSPSLIKVDVEGGEAQVLSGANKLLHSDYPPAWLIETHSPALSKICRDRLQGAGYEVDRVSVHGANPMLVATQRHDEE